MLERGCKGLLGAKKIYKGDGKGLYGAGRICRGLERAESVCKGLQRGFKELKRG